MLIYIDIKCLRNYMYINFKLQKRKFVKYKTYGSTMTKKLMKTDKIILNA